MSEEDLERLGVSPNAMRTSALFSEAYANTCIDEANAFVEAMGGEESARPITLGRGSLRSVLRTDRDAFLQSDPIFTLLADAASAYRDAGQAWMYIDMQNAYNNLSIAGELFWRLGYPFGLYLHACLGEKRVGHSARLRDAMSALSTIYIPTEGDGSPLIAALRHPQQQAYLLLAATSSQRLRPTRRDDLIESTLAESPHRSGVAPIGALGVPIRTYWALADMMLREKVPTTRLVETLVEMCRRYQQAMDLGKVNRYLWESAAAPVDIGDIDVIGVASLINLSFGPDVMGTALRQAREMGITRVGLGALEIGIRMADIGFGPSNDPTFGPR